MRALAIATFLGLALGYSAFAPLSTTVRVPAADEASLPILLGLLLIAAVLGGLLTEDLRSSVIQAFLALPIGVVIAFSLAVSPVATGFLEVRADDIFSFVVRLPIPLYLLVVPLYSIFGVIGLLIRERFGFRSADFLRPSGDRHRK